MSSIFISYRRTDAGAWAGRLADTLKSHLGGVQIFRDIEDIPPGVEFDTYILNAVGSCEALIALIGRGWLSAADKNGKRRLDDPEDFTRLEIVAALKRNVRVVPVLVDGAVMPTRDDLPDDLQPLARRQAYELTDKHWANDCRRLAEVLAPLVGKSPWPYKTAAIAAGAVAAVCIGAYAWWQHAGTVDTPQADAMQTRAAPASGPSAKPDTVATTPEPAQPKSAPVQTTSEPSAPESAPVPDAFFRLELKSHREQYLAADNCADTVKLHFSDHNRGKCQLWQLEPAGGGWHRLKLKENGKYLDALYCGDKLAIGNRSDFNGGACQLWKLVPAGGGWNRLQLKQNDKFVDANGCTNVIGLSPRSDFQDGACQLWRIARAN